MTTREHSVFVDPSSFQGPIGDLARILVPLVGQPSSTLLKRLERGEITIESDLSQSGAQALVDRLLKMGVRASTQSRTIPENGNNIIDLELELDLPSDFDLDDIFIDEASVSETVAPPSPEDEGNAWQSLFPDLDQPAATIQEKKLPPSLGELEQAPIKPPTPKSKPAPIIRQAPRAAESIMRDIIPETKRAPFRPDGFDDKFEHSPELAVIFSLFAPGAGHRYNGEDDQAQKLCFTGLFVIPWVRSIKRSHQSAQKIQSYHQERPKPGALRRTMIHITLFWAVIGVIAAFANLGYRQYQQHNALAASDKVDAKQQITEALASARSTRVRAEFKALEEVRRELRREPKQEISMTPEQHLERLYAIGVEKCKAKKYAQCQGIMAKVSRLKPGYRDVLVLQAWASQQRTSPTKTEMPKISEVRTLDEIEARDQ